MCTGRGVIQTPVGWITVEEENGFCTRVAFEQSKLPCIATPLIVEIERQIQEYFCGTRREFTIPLLLRGTEFQKKVWSVLCSIPYGETMSYQELAEKIGRPKAMRAVGGANHRNPIALLVPCHRVLGKSGQLVGYAGGLDRKAFLLQLEKDCKGSGKVI